MTWAALLSVSLRLTQLGLSAYVNCANNGVASKASLLEATPLFVSTCVPRRGSFFPYLSVPSGRTLCSRIITRYLNCWIDLALLDHDWLAVWIETVMSVVLLNHCHRYILLFAVACLCVLLGRPSYMLARRA